MVPRGSPTPPARTPATRSGYMRRTGEAVQRDPPIRSRPLEGPQPNTSHTNAHEPGTSKGFHGTPTPTLATDRQREQRAERSSRAPSVTPHLIVAQYCSGSSIVTSGHSESRATAAEADAERPTGCNWPERNKDTTETTAVRRQAWCLLSVASADSRKGRFESGWGI